MVDHIGKGEMYLWGTLAPRLQLVGGLDTAALEAEACQQRACRVALVVVLVECSGKGETVVVEGVIYKLDINFKRLS